MNNPQVTALIAARTSELRNALQALLVSIRQVQAIYQADDAQAALRHIAVCQPVLILVDFDLSEAVAYGSDAAIFVLVDSRAEQEMARLRGYQTFMKGTPVTPLIAAIESMLSERGLG